MRAFSRRARGRAGPLRRRRAARRRLEREGGVDQRPTVLPVENTHNSSAAAYGRSTSSTPIIEAARAGGPGEHLDGARLINAAVALGVPAAAIGARVDTVTLCLSKGLGCPLGALLAGSAEPIELAWREKFLFGGALRQAGIVAAAALYALDHHVERLAVDHFRARRLAEAWHAAGLPSTSTVSRRTSSSSTRRGSASPRAEALAALREAGRCALLDVRPDAHPRRDAPRPRRRGHRSCARARPADAGRQRPPEALAPTGSTGSSQTAQAEQRAPSVSAAVFRDGRRCRARGARIRRRRGRRVDATSDHAYRIGSITKTFTAVLVMQLVDEGRIDLEAPLRTYLPEAPVGPTIRMALSHLTGVQREPPGEIWESMQPPTREELIAGLEDAELVLRPGEQLALLEPRLRAARRDRDARRRRVVRRPAASDAFSTRSASRARASALTSAEGEPLLRRPVHRHGS